MDTIEVKQTVLDAIDASRSHILALGRELGSMPELGFKEFNTSKTFSRALAELGLLVEEHLAITGCKAALHGTRPGPRIGLMGELDAIVVPGHPDALSEASGGTCGAVHACGHNLQLAGIFGVVVGLVASGALGHLSGGIDVFATPAEEYIDLTYRDELIQNGRIAYRSGKQEFFAKGIFDGIAVAMMFHALDIGDKSALLGIRGNGFISKQANFMGKSAHAGSNPESGVNALSAAALAIMNINAQRETFRDTDRVRVHPILTKAGDVVNVVPSDVRMDMYVRASNLQAINDASHKVDRALQAGALAVGAEVETITGAGYLPLTPDPYLESLCRANLEFLGLGDQILEGMDFGGSFDFGDVSHVMPALHPMFGGISGELHSKDFRVADPERAIILPAKVLALTIVDLLSDDALLLKRIEANHRPKLTHAEYVNYLNGNGHDCNHHT